MIIPIHHTEEIPMMNCGEGNVFTKYGDNARTCMTKEQYDVIQAHNNQIGLYVGIGFILLVILSLIIAHLINKYSD